MPLLSIAKKRGKKEMIDQELVWLEPQSPKEIIEDDLIKKHKKDKFFVLVSGGQDSMSVDNFIAEEYPEYYEGRVFTNTGMGSPITRKFVLQNSLELNRKVEMTWAKKTYYQIVVEEGHGFPTPHAHPIIMGYLKFHTWYYYLKPKMKTENACFISGVRKKESWVRDKKRFYTKKPIDINATLTFCKPFLYKNGNQLQEYIVKNGIKKSPAYDWFDKSGECWCGCFYNKWELKMLEKFDPLIFQTIKWLESKVQEKIKRLQNLGTQITPDFKKQLNNLTKNSSWGSSVGGNYSELQNTLDGFMPDNIDDYCGESCEVED